MREAVQNSDSLTNYPEAWGLCNIFKQWNKWIVELSGNSVKRQLRLFNNDHVDKKNITQKFYADSEYGIAQTKQVQEGWPFNVHYVTKAILPEIENELINSFKKAGFNANNNQVGKYPLSQLLYIISTALDKVIDEKCNLN
jgi:hypothetical protein